MWAEGLFVANSKQNETGQSFSPAILQPALTTRGLAYLIFATLLLATLSGCQSSAGSFNNNGGAFQVKEYAIIEQSSDNPTHAEFQQRVQRALASEQTKWRFPDLQDPTQAPNEALSPFGYRLQTNPTPPFSAYALYHNDHLIERDITRFWPVSVKASDSQAASDFLLAFETVDGQRLVASQDGIRRWPALASASSDESTSPPVYFGDLVAYAQTGASAVSIYAGSGLLYSGEALAGSGAASNLRTWGNKHWAMEVNGHAIQDGKDLNQANHYDSVFQWHILNNQPFYFYTKNGLTRINYAGKDLPFVYDQVVHGDSLPMFTPGDNGHIVWFYALRDGVWYYVEAGNFQ